VTAAHGLSRAVRALAIPLLAVLGCASSGGSPEAPAPSSGVSSASPSPAGSVWGTAAALDSLRAGGIAVLGAVQVNEVVTAWRPFIVALDSVLAARWQGVPLRHFVQVRAALDDSTARMLLLGYQIHGRAEPLWLDRAADRLQDSVRYGVLARVRRYWIHEEERKAGRVDASYRDVTIRATLLESDVSFHLYDLGARRLLFSGNFQGFAERAVPSDSLPPRERPPITTWTTPEDRALEPMTAPVGGFPPPPPLDRSVANAIAMFADSLVGSGRRE
jgi:hypothetical protein